MAGASTTGRWSMMDCGVGARLGGFRFRGLGAIVHHGKIQTPGAGAFAGLLSDQGGRKTPTAPRQGGPAMEA